MSQSRQAMIDYLRVKAEEGDWHAVADAACDLRVLEAKDEAPTSHMTCANGHAEVAFAFDPKRKPGQEYCPVCREVAETLVWRKMVDEEREKVAECERVIAIHIQSIVSLKRKLYGDRDSNMCRDGHVEVRFAQGEKCPACHWRDSSTENAAVWVKWAQKLGEKLGLLLGDDLRSGVDAAVKALQDGAEKMSAERADYKAQRDVLWAEIHTLRERSGAWHGHVCYGSACTICGPLSPEELKLRQERLVVNLLGAVKRKVVK